MDNFFQAKTDGRDLSLHVGNMEQLAGINRLTYTAGRRDGIRAYEVYNAAGLHFTVLESRCLDIFNLWYRGMPLAFVTKPGLVAAPYTDLHGVNYLRSIGGGMLYTCGLTNVGDPFIEERVDDIFHGRVRFIPAENCGSYAGMDGDNYRLRVFGEMRDASLFYENLVLKREVSASMDSKSIVVHDILENRSGREEEYMIMYHLNCGYPVVDEGCKVFIPSAGVKPMNPSAEKLIDQWDKVFAPASGIPDDLFVHSLFHDPEGQAHTALYNEKIGLGLAYSFSVSAMEYIVEWRCGKAGDYCMGLFPANNHCMGRKFERENKTIKRIKPFEQKQLGVVITVIDGEKDLVEFKQKFSRCTQKE